MFKNKKVDEKFLKASKEHVIIYKHIETFQEILQAENKEGLFQSLKNALGQFEQDMHSHFDLEESVLFPAALTCISSLENCDQVLRFQKEHGYFEKDFEQIQCIVKEQDASEKNISEILVQSLTQLLDQFKEHALAESDLYHCMDGEKACQRLIKDIVIPA